MATRTNNRQLIVVVGPTASGKTELSLALAEYYRAPILSTDSRQCYRGMAIGTAQPTSAELLRAEHYFIASHNLDDELSCGRYEVQALDLLEKLFADHLRTIAVGGSGLYVRALCEGMDELPQADPVLRKQLAARLATEGVESLAAELARLDPNYHAVVDRQNPARVMRALEVCLQTGLPYSQQRSGVQHMRPFGIVKIGIETERDELYARIDRRVDRMMADGLEAEARALYPHSHLNALRTVGYRELFDYFDGHCTLREAVAAIKRNTRRYAKRQLTWFRRDPTVRWFLPDRFGDITAYLDAEFAES